MQRSNNKIRVLYVYPSLDVGGAEELRLLVLKKLHNKEKYDFKVCCIENVGKIGEKIKDLGIEVFCLNKSSRPINVAATISLTSYISKNRFDIVQTSLFNANFHGRIAAILAGVPIIISEEHSEHYQYRSLKFWPYILSDKILSIFTDKIICCSRNLMNSISHLERIPMNKLFPLLNTFNVEKLKISINPQELRKELGLSDTDIILVNIATLSYRKGQDLLIKAFKEISDRVASVKLIMIGNEACEFKQILTVMLKDLGLDGKVIFLSARNNVADYLNISNIFILSSRFEGIPLAMLEAMYMQVPVVAAEVGGISEVITHDKNGILVEPGNIEGLSGAIEELLANKEKQAQIAQEAKKVILERFNNERYLNQLEGLYAELLSGKQKANNQRKG
ncbi:MAG: glycosyltransferase [Candidatus Omnitrophica bacterium]|nr:glycosyltransferase [Candidatus Omnitrophota bacterium]